MRVLLGMTTWNTWHHTSAALTDLLIEQERLRRDGLTSRIVVVDNGSTDETPEYLYGFQKAGRLELLREFSPKGASWNRNRILDAAQQDHADYVAFVDGDIEVIPHSLLAMVRYLEEHPALAALAMNPLFQAREESEATDYCLSVKETSADALMYLCGYGLFARKQIHGMLFETNGPFLTPGWGYEDDDFYLQLVERGLPARYVDGYRFVHASPRSSWESLATLGIDPVRSAEERRAFLLSKWRRHDLKHVHSGHLNLIAGQHLHA